MRVLRNGFVAAGIGAALFVAGESPASAQAVAVKPTVSSVTNYRFTIIAKDVNTQYLKALDYTQYMNGGQPAWHVQGWTNIPNSTDASYADSTRITCFTGPLSFAGSPATLVVARKANNAVYYALRAAPTGSGTGTVIPAWQSWRSTAGLGLVGGPSAAFNALEGGGCTGMLFSRNADGRIYHDEYFGQPGFGGWHPIDGSPTDFVSDPDGVYTTAGVRVCARRADNTVWCAKRTARAGDPWTWEAVWQPWPVLSGPTLAKMYTVADTYEISATGSDNNIWSNENTSGSWGGWYMIPHGTSAADPDATVFVDLFNASTLSKILCTSDYANHTECFIYNPNSGYGIGWFYTL